MNRVPYIPHLHNISPFPNRISSASPATKFEKTKREEITIDELYGHSWNFELEEGDAVYGRTKDFSEDPLDAIADGNFVRVPFRRIPRIRIKSFESLQMVAKALCSKDDSITSMWRGQNQLHTLKKHRTNKELLKLYGETDIIEPSLIPSASRINVSIDDYMDAWFGLLDIYLAGRQEELSLINRPSISDEITALRVNYMFRIWSFGVAQHYGLPSNGLDLTPDINIALYFALNEFSVNSDGVTTIQRLAPLKEPVIFLMGVFKYDLVSDADIAPAYLETPRAKAQKAHFFQTAWGKSPNRAAERIVAVLDIVNHSNWDIPDLGEKLFPSIGDDSFCKFFKEAQTQYPEILNLVPLDKIYYTL